MTIVLAIIGLIVGGLIGEAGGALAGAALGITIGNYLALKQRIEALEDQVKRRDLRSFAEPVSTPVTSSFERPAPAPAPAPSVAASRSQTPPLQTPPSPAPSQPQPHVVSRPLFEEIREPSPARAASTQPPLRRPVESVESDLVRWVRNYFMNGNLVVRVGIIVLFFGVAFLLKFAADRNMLPIELRLASVAAGGAALLILGWRMRGRQRMYALALQGGGVGLLYLTVFAALRLYHLLPPTLAFALLAAVAALSAFLAVGQNSLALAALGATGGFMAPVLASTGQGNHVVLFTYYALLNAGVVAIAWFKAWRVLNLLAFLCTFGIGTAWGVLRYSPEHFATTEPFLILFFLMFLAVAVLFALHRAPLLTDYVDGTLVFGTPVVAMLLQSALVRDRPYALAISALAFGAIYLALAAGLWRRRGEELRLLAESFLALGVAFITLAVPLAFDGHWTAATWALEGAAILWIGVRQDRTLAIASGALLQLGAGVAFAVRHDVTYGLHAFAGSEFLGALFIALGGFVTARVSHVYRARLPESLTWLTLVPLYWALVWWFYACGGRIFDALPYAHRWPALLTLTTFTALACARLSNWNDWRDLRPPTLMLLPAMFIAAVIMIRADHLLSGSGAVAWPVAAAAWVWLLHWRSRAPVTQIETAVHVVTLWLFVVLVTFEGAWQLGQLQLGAPVWQQVVWGLLPAAALALMLRAVNRSRWPVSMFPLAYLRIAPAGIALYLALWLIAACAFDGSADPLPYLPIANPADLAQGFVFAALLAWFQYLEHEPSKEFRAEELLATAPQILAALGFIILNAVLLRALHHYGGVYYEVGALAGSSLVHASLSIFWGALALTTMVFATRRGRRAIWFIGAGLLAVVLAKMFLVDLSHIGSFARIVSFIAVGVLMLIIGRFSPLPPAETEPARQVS